MACLTCLKAKSVRDAACNVCNGSPNPNKSRQLACCVQQGPGQPAGLAAKMGPERERHRALARHPELLTQIAGDLLTDKWSGGRLEELLFHAYACPWLQTLLSAAEGHGWVLLLPACNVVVALENRNVH